MSDLTARARWTLQAIVLLSVVGFAGAQDKDFWAWSEDRPRFLGHFGEGHGNSIRSIADEHFPGVRFMTHRVPDEVSGDELASVVFRWLTDEPLFALTGFPDRIEEYIESFDLSAILNSWELSFHLEMALGDEMPVTDVEVLEAIGAPSNRVTQVSASGRFERWEYARYRLVLYFQESLLVTLVTY